MRDADSRVNQEPGAARFRLQEEREVFTEHPEMVLGTFAPDKLHSGRLGVVADGPVETLNFRAEGTPLILQLLLQDPETQPPSPPLLLRTSRYARLSRQHNTSNRFSIYVKQA
jgi:hypothetical protein